LTAKPCGTILITTKVVNGKRICYVGNAGQLDNQDGQRSSDD
jgi:hypothetical protein